MTSHRRSKNFSEPTPNPGWNMKTKCIIFMLKNHHSRRVGSITPQSIFLLEFGGHQRYWFNSPLMLLQLQFDPRRSSNERPRRLKVRGGPTALNGRNWCGNKMNWNKELSPRVNYHDGDTNRSASGVMQERMTAPAFRGTPKFFSVRSVTIHHSKISPLTK